MEGSAHAHARCAFVRPVVRQVLQRRHVALSQPGHPAAGWPEHREKLHRLPWAPQGRYARLSRPGGESWPLDAAVKLGRGCWLAPECWRGRRSANVLEVSAQECLPEQEEHERIQRMRNADRSSCCREERLDNPKSAKPERQPQLRAAPPQDERGDQDEQRDAVHEAPPEALVQVEVPPEEPVAGREELDDDADQVERDYRDAAPDGDANPPGHRRGSIGKRARLEDQGRGPCSPMSG